MNGKKDRIEAVFQAAMELSSPQEREAYLQRECGGDAELRREVEELLTAAVEAEEVFETRAAPPALEQAGSRIGHYHLLQKIGEGGCGVVYMAEQERPMRRKVALKIVKLGMDTRQVIARFEAERQALALMDHPNIAKVLDAGATENGRPYFVMELVRGSKITKYCDEQRLSTRQRLDLFIQVCQAVQHAHQKGIIHRDLKPSNVLVTERDGVPVPKVIDFGIAKATCDLQLTDKTLFTAFEQFIGTPAYMSPEQARLGELDIDTRSDIYSLGALLYELLTGQPPFEPAFLKRLAMDQVLKTIRETDPPLPSNRFTTMTEEERTTAARSRQVEPSALQKLVHGDLDWIVMKCLEKDRTRRYETANGLGMDIQRYLADEPVVARPPSRVYQVRRLLRRNKLAFGAGAAVTAALVCGLAFSTLSLERERTARRRAVVAEMQARQSLYAADMNLGYQALSRGNVGQVHELLSRYTAPRGPGLTTNLDWKDPRGWEWRNLWQRSQGDKAAVLSGHSNVVTFAGMLLDGQTVVSASRDRTLRFWDLKTRRLLEAVSLPVEAWCGALSPDGRLLAVGGTSGYWSLWDPASRGLRFAGTNSARVRGIAFSMAGTRVAVASERAVEVWSLQPFRLVTTISRPNPDFRFGIAFSPDGKTVAYSQGRNIIATNTLMLCELESGISSVLGKYEVGGALGLAFGADGRTVVSAERSGISVWDISSHRLLTRLTNHLDQVVSVAVSPDGSLMASASGDDTLRLWDTRSWEERRVLRGHQLEIHSVVFSSDGSKLISCGKDETVRVWDVKPEPTRRDTYKWPQGWVLMPPLSDTPRQLLIQIGNGGQNGIGFFDLRNCEVQGAQLSSIPLAPADGDAIGDLRNAVSGDLRRLAILQSDGSVEIWSTMPFAKTKVLTQSPARARGVALGRSSKWLAVERETRQIDILDLDEDRTVAHLEPLGPGPETSTFYSEFSFWARDTRFVRVSQDPNDFTQTIEVLLLPGLERRRLRLNHKDGLNNFSISSDGTLLATSAWDGQLKLWNVLSGEEIHTFISGQLIAYISVAISPDGSRIAAGAWDGTITMWDMLTWSQVAYWKAHASYAVEVCFVDDGNVLKTRGSTDKQWGNWETHVWAPPTFAEIRSAEKSRAIRQ